MSHLHDPRHKTAPPPRRVLALGGAALVTALTLGGALGFIPGAALGDTTARGSGQGQVSTANDSSDTSDAAGTEGSGGGGGGWLTVEPRSDDAASETAPAVPSGSGDGKRVVFDVSDQRVWLIGAKGALVRSYLVSGSIHDNLQPGTYEVYSRSARAVSFDGAETMRLMVRFAHGERAAIGFHDIPKYPDGTLAQTRSELGSPQSAGCIRQWRPDAKALWAFAPVGTSVVVTA